MAIPPLKVLGESLQNATVGQEDFEEFHLREGKNPCTWEWMVMASVIISWINPRSSSIPRFVVRIRLIQSIEKGTI